MDEASRPFLIQQRKPRQSRCSAVECHRHRATGALPEQTDESVGKASRALGQRHHGAENLLFVFDHENVDLKKALDVHGNLCIGSE
jgi:hypothetical protein